ncbi:alpha/beta fold hydrolase [Dermabacteraceae bacterium P7006]
MPVFSQLAPSVTAQRKSTRLQRVGDMIFLDHVLDAPLDWENPADNRRIDVFVREVRPVKAWQSPPLTEAEVGDAFDACDLPGLVFFQGGPGCPSPRPLSADGWLGEALARGFRVFLLDQRGTGRSSAVDASLAESLPAAELAEYLSHLRAPDIVRDAEAVRRLLCADRPWVSLGQSFGGFITLTYLSSFPDSLTASLFTGGLATVHEDIDDVYRTTLGLMKRRHAVFAGRFPAQARELSRIAHHLAENEEFLPTGERFTPERLQQLGKFLGSWDGPTSLAFLVEDAWAAHGNRKRLSTRFLAECGSALSFASVPLYGVLHESIYSQGPATRWSAHRMKDERDDFSPLADELLLTGESIHPWMFAQDPALVPFAEAAEILAQKDDWGTLYDLDALANCPVPSAAKVYLDDVYVPYDFSRRTAELMPLCTTSVTNRLHHDGLRGGGPAVFAELLDILEPRRG